MQDDDKQIVNSLLTQTKFSSYVNIVWGIMTIFFVMGILSGKEQASYGLIILCVSWTTSEIIRSMILSFKMLNFLNSLKKKD